MNRRASFCIFFYTVFYTVFRKEQHPADVSAVNLKANVTNLHEMCVYMSYLNPRELCFMVKQHNSFQSVSKNSNRSPCVQNSRYSQCVIYHAIESTFMNNVFKVSHPMFFVNTTNNICLSLMHPTSMFTDCLIQNMYKKQLAEIWLAAMSLNGHFSCQVDGHFLSWSE